MTNLSDQQINFYNDKGYVAPIDVLTIQEAYEIREEIELIVDPEYKINMIAEGVAIKEN